MPGFGGYLDLVTRKWVQVNGVDPRKVDWIEIPFPRMADSLASELVDAVVATVPYYRQILDANGGYDIGDVDSVVPPGAITLVYASTRSWAKQNAGAVKSFRAALGEATSFIYDPAHADAVHATMAKYTKLPPAAAATLAIPDGLDVRVKPAGFNFWIEILHEQGLLKGNPDPASLIMP